MRSHNKPRLIARNAKVTEGMKSLDVALQARASLEMEVGHLRSAVQSAKHHLDLLHRDLESACQYLQVAETFVLHHDELSEEASRFLAKVHKTEGYEPNASEAALGYDLYAQGYLENVPNTLGRMIRTTQTYLDKLELMKTTEPRVSRPAKASSPKKRQPTKKEQSR